MFRWYVINTYSGHEKKVKTNLEHRIESMDAAEEEPVESVLFTSFIIQQQ